MHHAPWGTRLGGGGDAQGQERGRDARAHEAANMGPHEHAPDGTDVHQELAGHAPRELFFCGIHKHAPGPCIPIVIGHKAGVARCGAL